MKDISVIIARLLLRVAKKEEIDELSKWEGLSTSNILLVNNLKEYWNSYDEDNQRSLLNDQRERLLNRIKTEEVKHRHRSLQFYIGRVAAIFIFALFIAGMTFYFTQRINSNDQKCFEVSTEAGQQSKVVLPDGSLVWLNSGTTIKYLSDNKERKVSLLGEAYFEVFHSVKHPFVVETGNTKIKVLGTKFNVAHYEGSKITETSLLSGKIEMFIGKGNPIDIRPGEKVVYDSERLRASKNTTNVQNDVLWKQGILVFENVPFEEMIMKLERYYAVTIKYNKETFHPVHYTGTIDNLSINRVLDFINLTIPINYEINNKDITLSVNKLK